MMAAIRVPAAHKRTRSLSFALLFVLAAAGGLAASAARAGETPLPPRRLELGFEERVRSENWDNAADFNSLTDDAKHQWRYRTRLMGKLDLGPKFELAAGLNNESRRITHPVTDFYPDETIFETLYLQYRFGDGVQARIGRQDITRGDGLVFFDPTPLDGSRTQYCNALSLGYAGATSRLDLYVVDDAHHDVDLPRFDNKNRSLTEDDERALAIFGTDTRFAKTTLEGYYVFKSETGDTRPLSSIARMPDRALHTLGGRAVLQRWTGWEMKTELAGQLGAQQPATNVAGWAATASAKRSWTAWPARPSLLVGWIGLSGDDPSTPTYEGWDPLFSRWPKWSEMMVYSLAAERGAGYWTDLSMWQAEIVAAPWKPLTVRATYYRMDAFQPWPGKASVFASGKHRGDMFQTRLDLKPNDVWRGHLLIEHLTPGSFYTGHDAAWFFRGEVIYSFKRMLGL